MKHRNTVFHQLLNFLPRHRFQGSVDRHKGDYRTRTLSCWDQLVALLFCQLSGRQSLRDLEDSFNSKQAHHYHLGTQMIRRSSLSDANNKRPVAIFQETFFFLLEKVRAHLPGKETRDMVRLIDSTTIDLNLNQFEWAKFRSTKAGIKLHTVYDPKNDYSWYYALDQMGSTFVGIMKSNACYDVIETRKTRTDSVLSDEVIQLSSDQAKEDCPIHLRRIRFKREEDQKVLVFISNDLERSAEEIADLYKQRWQIELFFKWIKQNLKIKRFLGRSENAVMIQVLVAMIAYLLLKLTQLGVQCKFSLQKIARLMSLNLTSRRPIEELLYPDPGRKKEGMKYSPQLELEMNYT